MRNTKPMLVPAPAKLNRTEESCAAAIRRANEELRTLLWRDEESEQLVGYVEEGLNRITCELENMAGRQELFEMWITAP